MARNDFIFWYDADEVSEVMDIEKINKEIENGIQQAEYNFTFAYNDKGEEVIKFIQCKAYDKRIVKWTGIIHEVVTSEQPTKRVFLNEYIYKIGHHQNQETGRHRYLTGLAVDCFNNPNNDRHSHYLARELFWSGRPKSALKEFKRHVAMNRWPSERAESLIFMARICGTFNAAEQIRYYNEAFYTDPTRNTALVEMAQFYLFNRQYNAAMAYAKASLEFKPSGFYGENLENYYNIPNDIISRCKLPEISIIIPQLGREESLKRCLDSIERLDYPKDKIEVLIEEGDETVPIKVAKLLSRSKYNNIVFASNDIEFTPSSLRKAVNILYTHGLVAFNTGELLPDKGNICEHFIIKKELVDRLGGEIFDTRFHHVGVDNLLWYKASKLGEAIRCEDAVVHHYHFSKGKSAFDEVYERGWAKVKEDRELLRQETE